MRSLFDVISRGAYVNNVDSTTTTTTSAALDTLGYSTGVLTGQVGLNSSAASPSAVFSLTECATAGGIYTAALANDGNAIAFTLTGNWSGGAAQAGMVRIEGLGLNRKRFLKLQVVDTVSGGSSIAVSGHIELGRSHKLPTQTGSNDY